MANTIYKTLSMELRTCRAAYFNARAMLKMANRGQVQKSAAFALLNQTRARYQRAIRLTVQTLDSLDRLAKIIEAKQHTGTFCTHGDRVRWN